jgi:hypothetical protein
MGASLVTIAAGASLFTLFFIVGAAPILAMAEFGARALVP